MTMSWCDLLFAHWPLPAEALRPLLPRGLELDLYEGCAWLSVVPFRMAHVGPRGLPDLPWISAFPELNVRTYAVAGGKPGVWFFSLDAANPAAVALARVGFHLPYFRARMSLRSEGDAIVYSSERTHRGAPPARFEARYAPRNGSNGELYQAAPGTLKALDKVKEEGLTAVACFALVDRGEGGREAIEARGVKLHSLFTRTDFIGS